MEKLTESKSLYNNLEKMDFDDLLIHINHEDSKVSKVVAQAIPKIKELSKVIVKKLSMGGRLFYIGSGTSGRLGILDASECPPTFGVGHDKVIGLIAGGDSAIRKAVETAEDDTNQAWRDLQEYNINNNDIVVGISASGTTPYVVSGLKACQKNNIYTGSITCNKNMLITKFSNTSIILLVGPEFITGSTRMKAGTAQKMTLNMLSTTTMIKLGHIRDNQMIDMHINNQKLQERGIKMIMNICRIDKEEAKRLLLKHKSVRSVINNINHD